LIVCVHLPRFRLTVAAGGPQALAGRALALAPTAGGAQRVGEVSGTAQARGVVAGMGLGAALTRCPQLALVPDDPLGVAKTWETAVRALEGIGADVQAPRPGLAYFEADGLRSIHRDTSGVIAAAREAIARPSRIGAAATRFCSLAASLEARSRRARIIDDRDLRRYLVAQPVRLLDYRDQTATLVPVLEQLGIGTLGQLVALGAGRVADRFGEPGIVARRLALGYDDPLRTRRVEDRLEESMRLGDSNSGEALTRTLGVLIDRLLARPERRGRTIRVVMLSARLVERGGTWCETVVFREALTNPLRIRLAISPKLGMIPAPAQELALTITVLGAATGDQTSLLDGEHTARLERLREAVRQVRTIAGPHAALRVLPVSPRARVPERRYTYTPFLP
jgi:protein ImuB